MLCIELPAAEVALLHKDAEAGLELAVDLPNQQIIRPNGEAPIPFDVDPFRKHCLINGLDDIGLTFQHKEAIERFDERRTQIWPWLDGVGYAKKGQKVVPLKTGGKKMEW
jgi:3-isopropylmalate dehydratase